MSLIARLLREVSQGSAPPRLASQLIGLLRHLASAASDDPRRPRQAFALDGRKGTALVVPPYPWSARDGYTFCAWVAFEPDAPKDLARDFKLPEPIGAGAGASSSRPDLRTLFSVWEDAPGSGKGFDISVTPDMGHVHIITGTGRGEPGTYPLACRPPRQLDRKNQSKSRPTAPSAGDASLPLRLEAGAWHFLAISFARTSNFESKNGRAQVWLDGQLAAECALTMPGLSRRGGVPVRSCIGGPAGGGTGSGSNAGGGGEAERFFRGQIGTVYALNRDASAANIASLYKRGPDWNPHEPRSTRERKSGILAALFSPKNKKSASPTPVRDAEFSFLVDLRFLVSPACVRGAPAKAAIDMSSRHRPGGGLSSTRQDAQFQGGMRVIRYDTLLTAVHSARGGVFQVLWIVANIRSLSRIRVTQGGPSPIKHPGSGTAGALVPAALWVSDAVLRGSGASRRDAVQNDFFGALGALLVRLPPPRVTAALLQPIASLVATVSWHPDAYSGPLVVPGLPPTPEPPAEPRGSPGIPAVLAHRVGACTQVPEWASRRNTLLNTLFHSVLLNFSAWVRDGVEPKVALGIARLTASLAKAQPNYYRKIINLPLLIQALARYLPYSDTAAKPAQDAKAGGGAENNNSAGYRLRPKGWDVRTARQVRGHWLDTAFTLLLAGRPRASDIGRIFVDAVSSPDAQHGAEVLVRLRRALVTKPSFIFSGLSGIGDVSPDALAMLVALLATPRARTFEVLRLAALQLVSVLVSVTLKNPKRTKPLPSGYADALRAAMGDARLGREAYAALVEMAMGVPPATFGSEDPNAEAFEPERGSSDAATALGSPIVPAAGLLARHIKGLKKRRVSLLYPAVVPAILAMAAGPGSAVPVRAALKDIEVIVKADDASALALAKISGFWRTLLSPLLAAEVVRTAGQDAVWSPVDLSAVVFARVLCAREGTALRLQEACGLLPLRVPPRAAGSSDDDDVKRRGGAAILSPAAARATFQRFFGRLCAELRREPRLIRAGFIDQPAVATLNLHSLADLLEHWLVSFSAPTAAGQTETARRGFDTRDFELVRAVLAVFREAKLPVGPQHRRTSAFVTSLRSLFSSNPPSRKLLFNSPRPGNPLRGLLRVCLGCFEAAAAEKDAAGGQKRAVEVLDTIGELLRFPGIPDIRGGSPGDDGDGSAVTAVAAALRKVPAADRRRWNDQRLFAVDALVRIVNSTPNENLVLAQRVVALVDGLGLHAIVSGDAFERSGYTRWLEACADEEPSDALVPLLLVMAETEGKRPRARLTISHAIPGPADAKAGAGKDTTAKPPSLLSLVSEYINDRIAEVASASQSLNPSLEYPPQLCLAMATQLGVDWSGRNAETGTSAPVVDPPRAPALKLVAQCSAALNSAIAAACERHGKEAAHATSRAAAELRAWTRAASSATELPLPPGSGGGGGSGVSTPTSPRSPRRAARTPLQLTAHEDAQRMRRVLGPWTPPRGEDMMLGAGRGVGVAATARERGAGGSPATRTAERTAASDPALTLQPTRLRVTCTVVKPITAYSSTLTVTATLVSVSPVPAPADKDQPPDARPEVDPRFSDFDAMRGTEEERNASETLRSLRRSLRVPMSWPVSSLVAAHRRRYLLRRTAVELFFVDGDTVFLDFGTSEAQKKVLKSILALRPPLLVPLCSRPPTELLRRSGVVRRWQRREITNFDYLMHLNTISGRTFNDLNQYPVFPWVLNFNFSASAPAPPRASTPPPRPSHVRRAASSPALDPPSPVVGPRTRAPPPPALRRARTSSEDVTENKSRRRAEGGVAGSGGSGGEVEQAAAEGSALNLLDVLCGPAHGPRCGDVFRDLRLPMGAVNPERLRHVLQRFKSFADTDVPPFHYGSHYSNAAVVVFFLIRLEPFASLHKELQGGKFDLPDRLFADITQTWTHCTRSLSSFKELIPEMYYLPEAFQNINGYEFGRRQNRAPVADVKLPAWANEDPRRFVLMHRLALESEHVSAMLPKWIDLIFGYAQRGKAAVDNYNLFHHLTYEGGEKLLKSQDPLMLDAVKQQIAQFGQTPLQLFTTAHPPRDPPPQTPSLSAPARGLPRAENTVRRMRAYARDMPKGVGSPRAAAAAAATVATAAATPDGKAEVAVENGTAGAYGRESPTAEALISPCYARRVLPPVATVAPTPDGGSAARAAVLRVFSGSRGTASGFAAVAADGTVTAFEMEPVLAVVAAEAEAKGRSPRPVVRLTAQSKFESLLPVPPAAIAVALGEGAVYRAGDWAGSLRVEGFAKGRSRCLLLSRPSAHLARVTLVAASRGIVATASDDRTVVVWASDRAGRGKPAAAASAATGPSADPSAGMSSPRGRGAARGRHDTRPRFVLRGHINEIRCLALDASSGLVLSVCEAGVCFVHSARTGKTLSRFVLPGGHSPRHAAVTANGDLVFVVRVVRSSDGVRALGYRMLRCNVNAQNWASRRLSTEVTSLDASRDGRLLATAGGRRDCGIVLWDVEQLSAVCRLEGTGGVSSVSFSRTGSAGAYLYAGTPTGMVQVYDISNL